MPEPNGGASAAPAQDCQASSSSALELLVKGVTGYAIYMLDPQGRIVTWNAGAERLKGYTAAEAIGRHFARFFTPEDREAGLPATALETARRVGRFEADGWRVRKDGSRFWANAVIDTIHDDHGGFVGFAKITRDISRRREAQQALIESERHFRLLVQNVVDYAIYMLDLNGLVVNWNAGGERLKGYGADEIVGQHFSVFYPPEDRAAGVPARALATAAREGKFEAEGWRLRKDGTRFFASVVIETIRDDQGALIGFAKITRDVTQRHGAEVALRESEHQFRMLVNGVTDYALYMLDLNGNVASWNSGAERIKGYAAGEIVGQHFSRFYTERDRVNGLPAHALATAAETGRYDAEGWRVRRDGSLLWASVVIDAIRDDAGVLVGFAKITRDVSERREAQLAMQKIQAQLAETQKMDALGQLTGGVAHDFNNLLMVISGHISTLTELVADHPRGTRAAAAIQTAAQRGAALTRQLLTFSRRQRVNPVPIVIADQIAAIHAVLTSGLGTAVRLVVDVPPATWRVKADPNEFEIALVNLVLNARDAMPDGGNVTITAENIAAAAGDASGDRVAITVADIGVGIAPDVLDRIFEPFFTTKAVGKGTGLGLSQVFGFAHQAGGSVRAESTLGAGTRIILSLPREHARPARLEGPPAEPNTTAIQSILLVEDNPDVADATTGLLEQLGYAVHCVNDAVGALAALEQMAGIDLVVSDIVMPGRMTGLALAHALREKYPALPVLLITGYSEAALGVRDEFAILTKPFTLSELGAAIAQLSTPPKGKLLPFMPRNGAR
jgi:PAS domain S-box-containing protein